MIRDIPENNQNIFIFGATNRPQDVDPAILRRFERSFHLALPTLEERIAIWATLLKDVPLTSTVSRDEFFRRCADLTEGYAASDIRGLCQSILLYLKSPSLDPLMPTSMLSRPLRIKVSPSYVYFSNFFDCIYLYLRNRILRQ